MGLALSEYLASQGAQVTIVARDVKKLEEAKSRIEVGPSRMVIEEHED